jgi:uncharacterized protein YhaN
VRAVRFIFNFFCLGNQKNMGAHFSHLWEKVALAQQGSDEGSRAGDEILSGKRPFRMRFETLVFERYGAFTDRVLELREGAHLHVVLGANEAGKTSALNAIGDLLFGFGKTTNFAFLHDQTTLRIGARLRLADGSQVFLRRRKGSKNTLLDADDKPLADDLLAGVLGSVTREVFVSEFGLTAEALRKGGQELLKAGGRLAETLAASSARLSMLAQTRARLETEADALFGPRRAAGKEFYAALDQHQDAERQLRDAIVTADALAAARGAVAEAEVKRQSLGEEHDRIGRDLARRERALRTGSKLRRLGSLRAEVASLADLPEVDAETLASWRDAHDEATSVEKELADQRLEEAEGAAAIAALMVDEPLLEIAGKIDTLNKELGAVGQAEIDLPGRQRDAFSARTSLDNAASLLGLEGHEALLTRQPSDLALTLVRELTDARRNLERRLAEAHSALMAARHELQELEQTSAKRGSCADPAPFLQRLEAFADIPADADRLRRETLARSLALGQLSEEAARLDPATPALDQLARLALPDAARIEEARQTLLALDKEEKRVGAEKKAMRDSLATIEEEIRSLSLAGAFSTRDELGAAREKRDRAYALLDAALDGGPVERRKIFMGLGVANRQVDATTDGLLDGAERAARFEAARERRAKEQRAYERLADLHDQFLARQGLAWTEWRELWAAVGLKAEAPQLMAAWLKNVNDILQRRARLAEQGLEHDALAQKLGAQRAALMRLVEDMGVDADAALPIEALYKYARAALDRLQAGWTETHARIALKDKAAEVLARAKESHAQIVRENESLHDAWPGALIAIGLVGELTPGQAEAALAVWKSVPLHKQKLSIERDRIEKMQVRISAFETQVAELVALAAVDLRERPSREALDILSGRLAEARRAHEQRETLRKNAQKRASAGAKLAQRRAGAHERLGVARTKLGLDESAPLAPAFDRLKRRSTLDDELADLARDLAESGDGFEEDALRREQADLDFDLLPSEIERLKIARQQIVNDIATAQTNLHEASRARESLAAGRDAARAAQNKAEAGAALIDVASRWLARVSAARLAAKAIERHRAAVQDPLLTRASALFTIATDGAFKALGADYDNDDTPMLVGLRENGARVPVAGMSEGARDQLFLSLRLALLELRAAEPLPFIGDDLLASFDETRTARALGLLAEFGRARQAIVFTHHQHVARIASELPEADVDVIAL